MTRKEALAVAKPILFNTDMVRAILDGTKTVERRLIKHPYYIDDEDVCRKSGLAMHVGTNATDGMPYPDNPYKVGDILYIRETWCDPSGTGYPILYKVDMPMHWDAENTEIDEPVDLKAEDYKWKPSIHMPKEAARIFLRITDVRVERLQNISHMDLVRDFALCPYAVQAVGKYALGSSAWESTIKKSDLAKYGWAANPWIWVIEFERLEVNDDQV